jgi:hypothetical protein
MIGKVIRTKDKGKVWSEAKKAKIPYLVFKQRRTTGALEYDMYTINYNLIDKAVEQIRTIFEEIVNKNTRSGEIWYCYGCSSGYLDKIPVELGIEYLPKISEIIENQENYTSCLTGE